MSVSFYVFDTVSGEIVSDELNVHNSNATMLLQLAGITAEDADGNDLCGFLTPADCYRIADLIESIPFEQNARPASEGTHELGGRMIDFGTNPAVFYAYPALLREIAGTAERYETNVSYQ
jgi:hypothetical protein